MPDQPGPALDAETIRRMAAETARITLRPAEVDALRPLLNSLLEEIRQVRPGNRAGAEPEPSVTMEDWPR
jgi:hypothetical protein